MKQKKIIVPILTLAVMLLMVGGVYAVFSSTQPEKSKAENVRIPLTKTMKRAYGRTKGI